MANPDHIEVLKRGVKEWNQWREAHPDIKPDFISANLSKANFGGADLTEADLIKANLSGSIITDASLVRAILIDAILTGADLSGTYLCGAYLSWAHLNGASMVMADLSGADLSGADLSGAILSEAILSEANLNRANFTTANLHGAILTEADLSGADLTKANLAKANLTKANLHGANLSEANLSEANLSSADIIGASLSEADLGGASLQDASLLVSRLINANFDGANLTGACLWATQRAGWSIKGVICESVYWDEDGEEETFYRPGEFERLLADKTKVKLFFKDNITPLEIATIPALIKHLEDSHPGCGLRLVSIHEDSGGIVVELAIEDDGAKSQDQLKQLKTEIEMAAQRAIEYERRFLAEEKQRLQLEGALKQSDAIIDKLILRPSVNFQGDYKQMGNTYNVSGQAGAVGDNAHAHDMTFNQIMNHFEQSIDLQALATELAELRQAMSQIQSALPQTAIALGKVAEAEIAAQEKNPSQVMKSLKAAGEWTLDFAKEIGKDVVVEAIKQSLGMS